MRTHAPRRLVPSARSDPTEFRPYVRGSSINVRGTHAPKLSVRTTSSNEIIPIQVASIS